VLAAALACALSVVSLPLTGGLGASNDAQFAVGIAVFVTADLVTCKMFESAPVVAWRRGRFAIMNAAAIFVAVSLTGLLRERIPTSWPVVAVGLELPLFVSSELLIDWLQERATPR
jgi:hypothetical protein